MRKLIVIYGRPDDEDHFRRHYETVHVPLARQVPGIRDIRYSFDVASDGVGHDLDAFCVFEAQWEDAAALEAAFASPAGGAVVADVAQYATGGFVRLQLEV